MTNKERFKEIFISQVTRPGAADLLAWLGTTDFFEAPASTRFHGAYPGGLVEHSLNVYYALLGQFTIREYGGESVAVVALLHDVCKTGYYRSSPREEKSGATRWRRRHGPRRSPARSLTAWASMNITSAPWPQRWRGVRSWSGRPTHAFPCSRRDNTELWSCARFGILRTSGWFMQTEP